MTLVKDNSVQAINTALLSVKRDISALTATKNPSSGSTDETTAGLEPGKTYNINISGNAATATRATSATSATTADKATTATTATTAENATTAETATTANKVANVLTVNGKTYDGSSAVDAGVQTVANGGTGATDAASGFNTLADGVRDSSTPRDDEKMLLKPSGTWYKTTCLDFWNYIKGKISSVLGLTKDNYGGKASTAGTADALANGSGKLKFFYAYSNNSKKLLKLGTFENGTEASFLLTVKRTDGLGFTGYLTINSNSMHSVNIKQFNGYKSSYSIYGITNGELVFLYRNDNNTNDVYIWCPSYGVVSIILMCGKNPWTGGMDTDATLTEVSGFSGKLLDKI